MKLGKSSWNKGKSMSKEQKEKISEAKKKLYKKGFKSRFTKRNTYWKHPNAINSRFKKGHSFDEEIKLKMLKNQRKAMKRRPTNPEKILIDLINKNNLSLDYVGDGNFWISNGHDCFNPDFINRKNKWIVEVFGDYWHTLTNNKIRDKNRILTYSNKGYSTLIFWEKDLRNINNHDNIINSIKLSIPT
jgi:very-short-patch-repair endonuclease